MKTNHPKNWPNDLLYVSTMNYKKIDIPKKSSIDGVRIVVLGENHFLHGQYGLIATKNFSKFNILGEYTGKINKTGNKFSAFLTEIYNVDASTSGNEMRFINDYRNIADRPNVCLEVCYIDKKPKILIVVIEKINEGNEILLDYGESYFNYYIKTKM